MSVAQQVAHQLVFHPFVSQSLRLSSTTLGRDKIYRAVQYFARFYAWLLISRGKSVDAARWNALKAHLALGRKLMRLGKPMEHLQAALRIPGGFRGEEVTSIGRQLCYFGYLTYDALIWANAVKFISLSRTTAQKVNKTSNRFWLAGISFSIAHGLLKAGRLANDMKEIKRQSWGSAEVGEKASRDGRLSALEAQRSGVRYQFAMDLLDFWIPASNVGLVNFNDGVLGLFGFITSVMALRSQWAAAAGKS
ncbi:peroxisomal biogenesis factor 11 [Punctularia strigosozonata HHB-11173 SS5]|uniref:peroxisomal biogenesis factor 11 n=1 Tax=Punctularia strigosozonata (strain HHB-11173) TaxID=741275 RepID=UPI0004416BF3|nr:peroxisomal biogenesis factor 11 [Punctularia strigosozonata HHB-11173 SS5]EIN14166.1 peroxisomal biogenesis factor 11 [Punctularia strigosozonata HHB-11173 SS5]